MAGLVTVQDGGRPGRLHQGVPAGGALVPELLARANRAVGNAPGEAALEIFGRASFQAMSESVTFALEDGASVTSDEMEVTSHPLYRVRYLAVRGGIDVPEVLGGRGTLLVAALGGYLGRALKRGDLLPIATRIGEPGAMPGIDLDAPIRVHVGPDLPEAIEAFLDGKWTLSPESNRTGTRLIGPPLERRESDAAVSTPMVPGAIQVPASGAPIVLGPDHPTTGGYPLIAVVRRADLGRFAARRIGAPVTFSP